MYKALGLIPGTQNNTSSKLIDLNIHYFPCPWKINSSGFMQFKSNCWGGREGGGWSWQFGPYPTVLRGLFLALCWVGRLLLVVLRESFVMPGIKPGLTTFKVSNLTPVLSLAPLKLNLLRYNWQRDNYCRYTVRLINCTFMQQSPHLSFRILSSAPKFPLCSVVVSSCSCLQTWIT